MFQISQYLGFNIEIIFIIFCIITVIIFINLIINSLKNFKLFPTVAKKTAEEQDKLNDAIENWKKTLPKSSMKLLQKDFINKILNILINQVIPSIFAAFLLIWFVLNTFPALMNFLLPADSYQTLTVTNSSDNPQKFVLLGRLSYSNDWKPIIPYSPAIQITPLKRLKANENATFELRTGINDIDYLIVANLSNGKFSAKTPSTVLSVPRNNLFLYLNTFDELDATINVSVSAIVLNILMYFPAILGLFYIFIKTNSKEKSEQKTFIQAILLLVFFLIPILAIGYLSYLNIDLLLYFI